MRRDALKLCPKLFNYAVQDSSQYSIDQQPDLATDNTRKKFQNISDHKI